MENTETGSVDSLAGPSHAERFHRFWKLCGVLLLALLGVILCGRMSHPWTYNDDYNGAFWSQAARNFSNGGYLQTRGLPAPLYFGPRPIPREALYAHHPTLLPVMMLIDWQVLGEDEAAGRVLPILFSLLTALLLWRFVSSCAGWRAGAFALAFFVAAPMELHYGQMVNFEAPELFFLLAALCCFHRWRMGRKFSFALELPVCCALAMATDWPGYLLVILLSSELLLLRRDSRSARMGLALLVTALLSGVFFLAHIRLADPAAWRDLSHAFQERSGQGSLSGGAFTMAQWARTQFIDLTTLFNPAEWLLAGAGALLAIRVRRTLPYRETAPLQIAGYLFIIDALYVCGLRNQSYVHDFAGFYLLLPASVCAAYCIELLLRGIERRRPGCPAAGAAAACMALAAWLICSGVRRLDGIDTQFCILDDDTSEPETLMPDLGDLIDNSFARDAVVICNFDQYYSPLPFYAGHAMTNDARSYAAWQDAVADAQPLPAGGIVWEQEPGAAELLRHLPAGRTRPVQVDGIPFVLWIPPGAEALRR